MILTLRYDFKVSFRGKRYIILKILKKKEVIFETQSTLSSDRQMIIALKDIVICQEETLEFIKDYDPKCTIVKSNSGFQVCLIKDEVFYDIPLTRDIYLKVTNI